MISVIVTIKLTTILDFLLPSITDELEEMATKQKLIEEFDRVLQYCLKVLIFMALLQMSR